MERPSQQIVDEIIEDIEDRRGLSGEWASIDDDIKEDIKKHWAYIVESWF